MYIKILEHLEKLGVDALKVLQHVLQAARVFQQIVVVQCRALVNQVVVLFHVELEILGLHVVDRLHHEGHVTVAEVYDAVLEDLAVRIAIETDAKLVTESSSSLTLLVILLQFY